MIEKDNLIRSKIGCYSIIGYFIFCMFLTAWNLLIGLLFLGIPIIIVILYLMFFIIKDLIKEFINAL